MKNKSIREKYYSFSVVFLRKNYKLTLIILKNEIKEK